MLRCTDFVRGPLPRDLNSSSIASSRTTIASSGTRLSQARTRESRTDMSHTRTSYMRFSLAASCRLLILQRLNAVKSSQHRRTLSVSGDCGASTDRHTAAFGLDTAGGFRDASEWTQGRVHKVDTSVAGLLAPRFEPASSNPPRAVDSTREGDSSGWHRAQQEPQ